MPVLNEVVSKLDEDEECGGSSHEDLGCHCEGCGLCRFKMSWEVGEDLIVPYLSSQCR